MPTKSLPPADVNTPATSPSMALHVLSYQLIWSLSSTLHLLQFSPRLWLQPCAPRLQASQCSKVNTASWMNPSACSSHTLTDTGITSPCTSMRGGSPSESRTLKQSTAVRTAHAGRPLGPRPHPRRTRFPFRDPCRSWRVP